MSFRPILKGSTNVSVVIRIVDSTDGTPENGVTSATGGLDLEYRREGAAVVDITESDLSALTDAHSDGGMLLIGNGYYRLDVEDAAFASGADGVLVEGTATGMVVIGTYVPLVDYNPYDAVRLGLTALPNAAAEAAGGLFTRGTGAGQINQANNGEIDVDLNRWNGSLVTDSAGTPDVNVQSIDDIDAPATWKASINTEVDSSIETYHLDHLLAADYDPASKPGVATALLNELVENNGGVSRYTAAALDQVWSVGTRILTASTNFNDLSAAEVNAEVDTALADANLDHLVGTATGIPAIVSGTYLDQITRTAAGTFDRDTDSLEAIRDRGDAAWTTGGGTGLSALASGTAQVSAAGTLVLAASSTFADNELNGTVANLIGGTGAGQSRVITGYTGSTDTATVYPNWTTTPDGTTTYEIVQGSSNLAAISLDGAAADNIELDYDGTGYAKANSTMGTVTTLTGHTAQTGDSFARIGATGSGLTSLAQASVLGALATAAASGDPTSAKTVMGYAKQLVNVLVGTDGVATWKTEQAPANTVSIHEVLRAIHDDVTGIAGAAMRGTDNAALASVCTAARLAELDAANLPADIDNVLLDTAEIGAAGAGLTEAGGDGDHLTEAGGTGDQFTSIPWNSAWDIEVESEVDDALVNLGLDHLVSTSVVGADVADDSIVARLVSSGTPADWDTFVNTTDSLQATRDHIGDGTNLTEAGGDGDHLTEAGGTGDQLTAVAQASVCTEPRLAELDAANLPTDVAARATPAQVNTEVADVLKVDTISEMAQQLPPIEPTFEEVVMYLYMALRNDNESTGTARRIKNNAGTVIAKATMGDDNVTFNQGTLESGP